MMNDRKIIYIDDAINVVSRGCQELRGVFARCEKILNELPPAQPERCSDCIAHGGDWECDHMHCRKGRLPSAQPEQQWIPVSERLPEPRVDVWVNSDIGQIQGYYEEHINVWYASFGQGRDYLELIVNAWMPLPESYSGE